MTPEPIKLSSRSSVYSLSSIVSLHQFLQADSNQVSPYLTNTTHPKCIHLNSFKNPRKTSGKQTSNTCSNITLNIPCTES